MAIAPEHEVAMQASAAFHECRAANFPMCGVPRADLGQGRHGRHDRHWHLFEDYGNIATGYSKIVDFEGAVDEDASAQLNKVDRRRGNEPC